MLDHDFPVGRDVGDDRATVGRQSRAERRLCRERIEGEEDDAGLDRDGKRDQVVAGRRLARRDRCRRG
jgi:hypothetical protein